MANSPRTGHEYSHNSKHSLWLVVALSGLFGCSMGCGSQADATGADASSPDSGVAADGSVDAPDADSINDAPWPDSGVAADGDVNVADAAPVNVPFYRNRPGTYDTHVRGGGFADENYGSEEELMVKWAAEDEFVREAYVRFDLSDVELDHTLNKATLRFYVSEVGDTSAKLANIYEMDSDDLDDASTWNTIDRSSSTLAGNISITEASRWYEVDVTDEVNEQVQTTGDKAIVFRIALDEVSGGTSDYWVKTWSLEHANRNPNLNLDLNDEDWVDKLLARDWKTLTFRKHHMLQDFSQVGYELGVDPPTVSVDTSAPKVLDVNDYKTQADADDTIAIQRAIDKAIVLAGQSGQQHVVYLPAKSGGQAYKVSISEAKRYFEDPASFWSDTSVKGDSAFIQHYTVDNNSGTTPNQVLWIWGNNVVLKGDGPTSTYLANRQPSGDYKTYDYMRGKSIVAARPKNGERDWSKLQREASQLVDSEGMYFQITDPRIIPIKESVYKPTDKLKIEGTFDASDGSISYNGNVLRKGDWIVARAFATQSFIDSHEGASWWRFNGSDGTTDYTEYRAKVTVGDRDLEYHYAVQGAGFYRQIVDISGDTITLDVPVRYELPVGSGACVYKADELLENVGIEDIGISSQPYQGSGGHSYVYQVDSGFKSSDYSDSANAAYYIHGSSLITYNYVRNGWIRSVQTFDSANSVFPADGESFHFLSNGIVLTNVRSITVDDCNIRNTQFLGQGGNGYAFTINNGNENIIKNCRAGNYRHGFSFAHSFCSGNVIYKCELGAVASGSYDRDPGTGISEMHDFQLGNDSHMWFSQASLVDSVTLTNDFLISEARTASGSPGRWAGLTNIYGVFWNIHGTQYRDDQYWEKKQAADPSQVHLKFEPDGPAPWLVLSDQAQGWGYVIGTSGAGKVADRNTDKYLGTHAIRDLVLFEKKADQLPASSLYEYQKQ